MLTIKVTTNFRPTSYTLRDSALYETVHCYPCSDFTLGNVTAAGGMKLASLLLNFVQPVVLTMAGTRRSGASHHGCSCLARVFSADNCLQNRLRYIRLPVRMPSCFINKHGHALLSLENLRKGWKLNFVKWRWIFPPKMTVSKFSERSQNNAETLHLCFASTARNLPLGWAV